MLDNITIRNRTDCCAGRLNDFRLSSTSSGPAAWSASSSGQFVHVKLNNGGGDNYLQMAEVEVFGDVADASGVPEPATMGLTAGAFAVAAFIRRKVA